MVLKRTPNLIAQVFATALAAGGVPNAMSTASRRVLRDLDKKMTTEADLERLRAAQAKRERRAARNARSAA